MELLLSLGSLRWSMWAMLVLVAACLVIGVLLVLTKEPDIKVPIGTALLTGAVFAAVAFLAQQSFEDRAYLNSLTMAGDRAGFDDLGHDLGHASLSNRSMRGAQLVDARMEGANLADSDLSDANLEGAHLKGASLFHTAFDSADLRHADLRQANLRGATFYQSWFPATTRLHHAHADLNTCWPVTLASGGPSAQPQPDGEGKALLAALSAAHLVPSGVDDTHKPMSRTIGHVCTRADRAVPDGQPAPTPDRVRIRVCVDGTLIRVLRSPHEADHPVTCERPSQ